MSTGKQGFISKILEAKNF